MVLAVVYGVETWTLKAQSPTKRKRNLKSGSSDAKLTFVGLIRKTAYLSHILCNDKHSLLQVQGRKDRKRHRKKEEKSGLTSVLINCITLQGIGRRRRTISINHKKL